MTEVISHIYKITVVIVTYGNRWNYLSQALNSVKDNQLVSDIIVVDNGSKVDIGNLCKSINSDKICVIRLEKNTGSAGGFYVGIKTAYEKGKGDFIFLLDDDNVVEENCFENLISWYIKLGNNPKNCLKAFKYNNKSDVLLMTNYPYLEAYNSFSNFHILNKIKEIFLKPKIQSCIKVRAVAYSGFMFHKSVVDEVGYPNKDMILYGDDTEYSLRFKSRGYDIFLILDARLKDLEISWCNKNMKGNSYFWGETNIVRMFYSLRNRVYVEKKYLVKNKLVYFLNFAIYFLWHATSTLIIYKFDKRVFKRILLFLKACRKGWKGELKEEMSLENL
ncbi:MAG: glycosyltransferase [Elusimicrobiota bacterium]